MGGTVWMLMIQGISKFKGCIGKKTVWDGGVYTFSRDVVDGMITTIQLPADAFEIVPNYINMLATAAHCWPLW